MNNSAKKKFPLLTIALLVLALPTLIIAAESFEGQESRPNIVLVMADDQGWGDMGYQGHPVIKTPNFDEAAKAGIRFNRFYAAAPVCSPTRASVMTGRHPNRMGVFKWGYPIRPQEQTIAEILKSAGYQTAHFGKWHLGSVRKSSPVNPGKNGFDDWLSAPNFYDNDAILSHQGKAVQTRGESSMVAADAAIDWITRAHTNENPFFAVVWFGSPHSPHRAAKRDQQLYSDQPQRLQNFYGEITGMDRAFGKIRKSLRQLKIEDNTILWYCSDNGALPNIGSTGGHRGHKGKVYDGGLLVPAILEWPKKLKTPRSIDTYANTCDIFPTLVDAVGLKDKTKHPIDGISLIPVLSGEQTKRTKGMGFWDHTAKGIGTPSAKWMGELLEAQKAGKDLPPHESSANAAKLPSPEFPSDRFPGHSAWIQGHWKLHRIEGKQGTLTWELFDLSSDPAESRNVYQNQQVAAEALKPELESWLRSVVASLNGKDYSN